jgi:hypothetical protein
MLARGKRAFEARDGWRLRSHEFCDLRLGQAGVVSGLQQQVEKRTFFVFDALHFLADTGPAHELGDELIMGSHA